MQAIHEVKFTVGDQVFVPRVHNGSKHSNLVVLKVGRKFAFVVSSIFQNTDDEKEMTLKVDLETLKIVSQTLNGRKVYQSEDQYNSIEAARNQRATNIQTLKDTKWGDFSDEKLAEFMALLAK